MEKPFMEAMYERYSCKRFDERKKVNEEDLRYILDAGILSPSSLGLEHWKFLVVANDTLQKKLQEACWNQAQVGTASHVVVVLAKLDKLQPSSPYVKERLLALVEGDGDKFEQAFGFYQNLFEHLDLACWSTRQCYLAAANMMSAAKVKGIDSCPMEGFEKEKIRKILDIDKQFDIALIIPFGYGADTPRQKNRLPFEQLVKVIK